MKGEPKVAFDLEKVEELLNTVGLDLMMISTDNLVEISDILGKIEPLAEAFAPLESDLPGRLLDGIRESLEAVIRGQISEVDEAVSLVGDGLTMLQDLARSLPVKAPFKGDVDAWAAALSGLATLKGFLGDPEAGDWPPAGPDRPLPEAWDEGGEPEVIEGPGLVELAIADEPPPWPVPEARRPLAGEDPAVFFAGAGEAASGVEETFPDDLAGFQSEFAAEVEAIQVMLVAIEQKSDPQAALGELTRNFKNLLGVAGLLNLEEPAQLAYNAGDLVEYVAADHVPYSTAITDILLKAGDHLLKGFRGLEPAPDGRAWRVAPGTFQPGELDHFTDELWLARQGVLPVRGAEPEETIGARAPAKPKKIGEILVEKGLISEGDLGGLIEAQQNARKVTLGDILIAEKLVTPEDVEEALGLQKKSPGKKLGEILVEMGRIEYEEVDKAIRSQAEQRETKLGEFLVKSKIGAPEKVAVALREQKQSEGAASGPAQAQTVKVETLKLDGLIDLVGELVIAQSLITANESIGALKEQKINKDLAQVGRITSELQRNAMSLRMVQIRQTFQKMNRLVRDLAHKFEKDVRFETVGSDTEIDRNMVESIYDPLVHLVRNALDHGLETPDERRARGKPPQGLVRLKAYHQGGNVVIELFDDGRGLDKEKALKKAVERGLVSPGEVLSDAAVHALIFQPGFSTADHISDISGRGVGTDVVKKSIEKLRGKVDFTSSPGRGSTMTIRLPLTLAIIDGMIVRVGAHRYILPTISIVESFRPPAADYFTVRNQGEMMRVRERLMPLIRLDRIVGAEGALNSPEEALVVVVENEGETRCLLVDEVLGKQEVVIKSLGERLNHVRALAGGTILGDGRVGLILDVGGLFKLSGLAGGPLNFGGGGSGGGAAAEDWGMDDPAWGG